MDLRKYIGTQQFYKRVCYIALPIALQQGITNFVSLLDNIMVGQLGTEQMSGVSVANQLIFVYNLCIFGALSGAGIFTTQYFGKSDKKGIQHTFHYKLLLSCLLTILAILVFVLFHEPLILSYLNGDGDILSTLFYGKEYLMIMLVGLPGFMMMQVYSNTLRECNETILPMKAGLIAVAVNLIGNYLLIYGKFGLPALGCNGAAIATVLSRYIEASINIIGAHINVKKNYYLKGIYQTLYVPFNLVKKYFVTGFPLLLNETMWAAGMAVLAQCYSLRGMHVVASMNISNTISNVANVSFIAMGSATGILIGQCLGANKIDEAKQTCTQLTAFSVVLCTIFACIMCYFSSVFPSMYNTEESIRKLAAEFIFIQSLFMPLQGFVNCIYFTIRAGGKTIITFFFDSVYQWIVLVSIAYILSRYTDLPVITIFICVQSADILKAIIGKILVNKGIWIHNIVS